MTSKTLSFILVALAFVRTLAFAPTTNVAVKSSSLGMNPSQLVDLSKSYQIHTHMQVPFLSSSNTIAAATVDPTTALAQVLGGLLGSPAILLVPILAAVSVATVIAWFIVSYANPADPDE